MEPLEGFGGLVEEIRPFGPGLEGFLTGRAFF
jgi:hypothetical protein